MHGILRARKLQKMQRKLTQSGRRREGERKIKEKEFCEEIRHFAFDMRPNDNAIPFEREKVSEALIKYQKVEIKTAYARHLSVW